VLPSASGFFACGKFFLPAASVSFLPAANVSFLPAASVSFLPAAIFFLPAANLNVTQKSRKSQKKAAAQLAAYGKKTTHIIRHHP